MITAYDATFARLVDLAGVDMILVGDSVGMVVQGTANTIPVELDEMAYHVRLVAALAAEGADRRRPALRQLPGQPAAGGGELDPADEGRRRVREAGGRRGDGRDDPGDHPRRHPGDRPHRPHPAELPPHGRPQGAGQEERLRGGRPRAAARRRARGRTGRRVRGGDRRRAPRPRQGDHAASCRSRRSASVPAPTATARCWCCTTCRAQRAER